MNIVNKKNKNANMKAHNVKGHLWVFVNALVDNPAFDSQTKETLTTRQGSLGSKCDLSDDFLKKVGSSAVVSNLLSWADFKLSKELQKTDGSKRSRLTGIPKLEDANDAGGKDSQMCTLILTEGDSAKALAMAGIAVVGRNHYGVFPLRGKLLNVREASHKQIMDNAEIQNIKQILGLQHGKQYDSTKGLRYGHLMIMTDQDHDGSHIKGLLINFIHSFWPSLLKIPSFLVEFITPIIKATNTRNKSVLSFYSMPEYEQWKESLGGSVSGWSIKYYKGLGTSTSTEGRKYFEDIVKHKKDFVWLDDKDDNDIELAFSKKRITDRKDWLSNFQDGTYLDQHDNYIKYSDFINKELIQFSMADLLRSIPSMVDGLKPGQRKILFCSFKRNLVKEAKVAQFSGYVSEHSAYHHGEQSLASTIVGMAQDFVGSNNINLLLPNGQFGTRDQGGKDAASARYIFTKLSPITRSIFPKDDDILLNYLSEDGQSIEPTWYVPIIPMVLVNGSEGIGTGWSTFIPNYNPRDIVANLRRLLNSEPVEPMDPFYRGFKGTIQKTSTKVGGVSYTVTGIVEVVDDTTLRITELPIRRWSQDYKEFLYSIAPKDKVKDKDKGKGKGKEKEKVKEKEKEKDKDIEPFIQDVEIHSDDKNVEFLITLSKENMAIAMQEGLEKKFKLTTTIGTTNMHLFDSNGKIRKFDTPEDILEDFFGLRLEFYEKRKRVLLENIELELKKLSNKVRFIVGVVKGEIIVNNRKRAELFMELQQKGFDPFPKKKQRTEPAAVGATEEDDENEESPDAAKGVNPSDYEYLLSLAIGTLTLEKVQELIAEKGGLETEVEELKKTTPKSLWMRDLDTFEKELDVLDEKDRMDAEDRRATRERNARDNDADKGARKRRPKKTTTSQAVEGNAAAAVVAKPAASRKKPVGKANLDGSDDEDYGAPIPKPAAQKKKQAKKASAPVRDADEDEVLALKDRLAAYNLDDPSEDTAMETETTEKQPKGKKEPSKRGAARKNALTVMSEDDQDAEDPVNEDDEDDFSMEEVQIEKKGRGRKPAAEKPKAAATRKRAPAQGKAMRQKVMEEIFKPTDDNNTSAPSPEKKVRKMRASPFHKKSGSILQKGATASTSTEDTESSSALGSSAEPVAPRPTRQTRGNKKSYEVQELSDDTEDEVQDISADSDFEDSDFGEDDD
ncbi:hypothetical protein GUJ93_ZPchr0006g44923 [Zizania palustris]|uniref:DNA topoisomerase 2 n=1 Tax=Zizania palustris TaxID=103762 RepID=A0A8J5SBY5_ZIZPA|nr:hypothetical protein GUJ93_ZPchr0006g44923 [Zizania palustris]KAG8071990.1 hypothetical protein GUJ93_ZPchr0006g44923 [Zizania palustris]